MPSNNTNNAKESLAAFLLSPAFLKRTLTFFILAPLGLWLLCLGNPYRLAVFVAFYAGFLLEWTLLIKRSFLSLDRKIGWYLGGTLYITGGVWGFYYYFNLKTLHALLLLLVIWATDIGAYLFGKLIGGPKLCPKISPQKTWAGMLGGTFCALLVIVFFGYNDALCIYPASTPSVDLFYSLLKPPLSYWVLAFVAFSLIGQLGDLLESAVKRRLQVKDTGNILPGHGGLLDRFDSFLAVGIAVVIWLHLSADFRQALDDSYDYLNTMVYKP